MVMEIYLKYVTIVVVFSAMSFADATLRKRLTMVEKRIGFVETRMNNDNELANEMFTNLQQNYEELNNTVIHMKEQMCPKVEISKKTGEHKNKKEIVKIDKHSKMLVSLGIESEKKWTRDQVEKLTIQFSQETDRLNRQFSDFTNQVNLQNSLLTKNYSKFKTELIGNTGDVKSDLESMVTDIDDKIQAKLKEMTGALNQNKKLIESQNNLINVQQAELEALNKFQEKVIHFLNHIKIKICPQGWVQFLARCHLFVEDKKTFSEARADCNFLGATLADFESLEENNFIAEKFKIFRSTWIGYSDEEEDNNWVSFRTGQTAPLTYFRSGEPNGGTEQNCVIMGFKSPYNMWNDYPCVDSFKFQYICKKDTNNFTEV